MGEEEQRNNGGETKNTTNKYAVACSIIGSIISILMGYDSGVMSGAMLFIKEDLPIKSHKFFNVGITIETCCTTHTSFLPELPDKSRISNASRVCHHCRTGPMLQLQNHLLR